jgi:hypothetical protein
VWTGSLVLEIKLGFSYVGISIMKKEKLARAYFLWRKKKSICNFKRMLKDGFHGGFIVWRAWRVIKNTLSGKYEKLYQEYWKEYDVN